MKSVLVSVKPEWCDLIMEGQKTLEIRKTKPNIKTPFKCYIYKTRRGGIIGEFICDEIEEVFNTVSNPPNYMQDILPNILTRSKLSKQEFAAYVGGRAKNNNIYGWSISNLLIYDEPKPCDKPPQDWYYVND